MGNLLQYTDKSETIDNKLNSLLAEIKYDYNNGNIRTETEYYYRIKNMLSNFYDSLTKPTFKYRPAVSTPMSDEYNAMIQESYNDMEYIIKDCEALNNLVSQSFIDAELSRNMLTNEIAYLSKKISSIGESIVFNQSKENIVFTESFNNRSLDNNIDDNSSDKCYINTENGILTLYPSMHSTINIKSLSIDNEVSNGFPGNTHCVDTLNNEIHFIGQNGLHMDPGSILRKNKDEWFEFELFSITDETRSQCNSYGFEFDEGVEWVNNDDILRLKIIIDLSSKEKCSWISMNPYLSDVKGIKNCFIETCNVITDSNNIYNIGNNIAFDDVLVFPFPPQEIKRIEITFVQPSKYMTKIGHFYYTSANTSDMSIFQDYDYTDKFARVDGNKQSVGLLGCKYDPESKWVKYPDSDTKFPEKEYTKSKLFTLPESYIDKKANQEIIDAYRYMIGIRNISISSYTFKEYGEYVSTPFVTDDPITSITLESNEYIPGDNDEILRYFISVNGGLTWHKIYPSHRAYNGIYKYYINNNTIENLLSNSKSIEKKSKNLSIVGDCYKVQLKIEMERATGIKNEEYTTPIVYDYKLKLTTGGESIEY